jgi:Arc/MetJ-type ribon-helix-helix transcriptional regulator
MDVMKTIAAVASRRAAPDTEKLTINLGVVDLGQIDLLVQEGFYSNRTDLIRTAIRNQLTLHGDEIKRTVARRMLVLGLHDVCRSDLERMQAQRKMLDIQVVGLVRIADDISAKLALATIASIEVLGALHAPVAVRTALAARIR